VKVYKIQPDAGCNSFCEKTLESAIIGIKTFLDEGCEGMLMSIRILEMEESEYDKLPEYMGP